MPTIHSILIANRGEIARRVMRTCRDMGIRTVAVYSDADVDMPFVREADLALRLGPPPAVESYLDVEKLLTLAVGNGVDAIHPGYGFLAENPGFSSACADAGITFIGPTAEVIRAMGDKGEAKRRMEAAGVPVVPGYVGDDQSEGALRAAAGQIGFPLLIKAVAGGGGRGIRLVKDDAALSGELEGAQREARNAFGDARVMLERFVEQPRHVEFQVLADTHGTVLHLFERDCSVQRRHQKVVEETPSPALNDDLRGRMADAAVRAAQAIDYVGAGTVEFLVDGKGAFYFLEMNTRLQVEHPITEATLGVDLVRLQIEVAEGRPLRIAQPELVPKGHAIECRLNAEDPARNFLPSVGRLAAFAFPAGEGLRADAGFAAGGTISPYYDSLLAKLIAWGPTREEALRRMTRMLAESRVAGIASNLPLLQGIVTHPAFQSGDYTTHFLDEHSAALSAAEPGEQQRRERLLAAACVEAHLAGRGSAAPRTPGSRNGASGMDNPWDGPAEPPRLPRPAARLARQLTFGGTVSEVVIEVIPSGRRDLRVSVSGPDGNGTGSAQAIFRPDTSSPNGAGGVSGQGRLDLGELQLPMRWDTSGNQRWLTLRGEHLRYAADDPVEVAARVAGGAEAAERLRSPLPGKVLKVEVQPGATVQAEQVLLVLEAMKVEHKITAPYAGTVGQIHFSEGQLVNRDVQLLELEPEEG